MEHLSTENPANIRDMVMRERQLALSEREWKHRLRGYGYAIRETTEGRFVTSLLRGAPVCQLN